MKRVLTTLGLAGALAASAISATAQDEPAPLVSLNVKPGDTFRFRRTRERTAVCEQLDRDGDDRTVQEYTVKVTAVNADGSVELDVHFTRADGHVRLTNGELVQLNAKTPLPDVESTPDLLLSREPVFLRGAELKVTLSERGRVVAETGMRDALRKAFEGTPLAPLIDEYPQEEGLTELLFHFPDLPARSVGDGGSWEDDYEYDFGARSGFVFHRRWRAFASEGDVLLTADCEHIPGDKVPDGQTNSGSGTVVVRRSARDGFLLKQVTEVRFQGRGRFDIDARFSETIERLPPE